MDMLNEALIPLKIFPIYAKITIIGLSNPTHEHKTDIVLVFH